MTAHMPASAFERAVPTRCRVVYTSRTVRVYLPRDAAGSTMGLTRVLRSLPAGDTTVVRRHRRGESVVTIPVRASEAPHVALDVVEAVKPTRATLVARAKGTP